LFRPDGADIMRSRMEQTPATRRACWIGALLPVCFAIWLHRPMWDAGLLSDDLVLRAYVADPGPHGPSAAWRRVLEDLQGPWLFGPPLFYRPLASWLRSTPACRRATPT
jgi:hypothetical protein